MEPIGPGSPTQDSGMVSDVRALPVGTDVYQAGRNVSITGESQDSPFDVLYMNLMQNEANTCAFARDSSTGMTLDNLNHSHVCSEASDGLRVAIDQQAQTVMQRSPLFTETDSEATDSPGVAIDQQAETVRQRSPLFTETDSEATDSPPGVAVDQQAETLRQRSPLLTETDSEATDSPPGVAVDQQAETLRQRSRLLTETDTQWLTNGFPDNPVIDKIHGNFVSKIPELNSPVVCQDQHAKELRDSSPRCSDKSRQFLENGLSSNAVLDNMHQKLNCNVGDGNLASEELVRGDAESKRQTDLQQIQEYLIGEQQRKYCNDVQEAGLFTQVSPFADRIPTVVEKHSDNVKDTCIQSCDMPDMEPSTSNKHSDGSFPGSSKSHYDLSHLEQLRADGVHLLDETSILSATQGGDGYSPVQNTTKANLSSPDHIAVVMEKQNDTQGGKEGSSRKRKPARTYRSHQYCERDYPESQINFAPVEDVIAKSVPLMQPRARFLQVQERNARTMPATENLGANENNACENEIDSLNGLQRMLHAGDQLAIALSQEREKKPEQRYYCMACDIRFKSRELYMIHLKMFHICCKEASSVQARGHNSGMRQLAKVPAIDSKLVQGGNFGPGQCMTSVSSSSHKDTACGTTVKESTPTPSIMGLLGDKKTKQDGSSFCGLCGYSSDISSLVQHMEMHCVATEPKCNVCGKIFMYFSSLKNHAALHTGERPNICPICSKAFTQSSALKGHMIVHSDEKPHKCDQCGQCFRNKKTLAIHERLHTGEEPYQCPHCGKRFKQATSMKNHLRVHTGERPYVCTECGAAFAEQNTLKNHKALHSPQFTYKCEVCPKMFRQRAGLAIHMKTHSNQKPFPCEQCGQNFKSTSTLKNHRRLHSEEKPFQCLHCPQAFKQRAGLSHHMKHHKL